MLTAVSTALSGLRASSDAINVIGNDLSNLNTTGYKANELNFQDLISESMGSTGNFHQVGVGVAPVTAVANYSQGALQTTNGSNDAAIQGNGFFVVQDPISNQTLYTRDGNFQVNTAGQLMTDSGQLVQGWSAVNGTVNTSGPVGNLGLPLGSAIAGVATTKMNFGLNLDSSEAVATPGATVTAPVQVYDSEGLTHNLTATFTKTANNTWSYAITVPNTDLAVGGPGATTLTSGNLTFDNNGNLTAPAVATDPQNFAIPGLADGAANLNVGWNLYDSTGTATITQYGEPSSINSTTQNGYAAGTVSNVALATGGALMATYTNGQKIAIGQLALASISNPSSLSKVGDNNLAVTASTSTPVIGVPSTGDRGQIVAGALESSTVDIATEFANLLTFQRSYQADSRVITTSDQLTQETVNLIHG